MAPHIPRFGDGFVRSAIRGLWLGPGAAAVLRTAHTAADAAPPNEYGNPGGSCTFRGEPGQCITERFYDRLRGRWVEQTVCITDLPEEAPEPWLGRRARRALGAGSLASGVGLVLLGLVMLRRRGVTRAFGLPNAKRIR